MDRGPNSEAKAKRVLLRRLGIITDDDPISHTSIECYNKLFECLLASDIVQALVDSYGWKIPTNVAALLGPLPAQWRFEAWLAMLLLAHPHLPMDCNLNIIYWNVRELNSRAKHTAA